jgi:hypothetical protein
MTEDRIVTVVRDNTPKEVEEDTRSAGPTPFLQENGYQPNRKKEEEDILVSEGEVTYFNYGGEGGLLHSLTGESI